MSMRLLKLFFNELKTVRIICQHNDCNGVVELSLEQLEKAADSRSRPCQCPVCGVSFHTTTATMEVINDPLSLLARTARSLAGAEHRFRIEFVLPDEATQS